MRLADKIPFYYLQFSVHDISCRDSVRLSRFYLLTPGVLSVDATFTRFSGFCHFFFSLFTRTQLPSCGPSGLI